MSTRGLMRALKQGLELVGIDTDPRKLELMEKFGERVLDANRMMNLTRIQSKEEFAIKHYVDSLLLTKLNVEWESPICDVGTGPGFPGVPLAIYYPQVRFVLMDSVSKKVDFVNDACERLGLKNIHAVHGRVEDLARREVHRQQYNGVVARAVAPLPVLVEYCLPLVKVGGWFIAMKGSKGGEEVRDGADAVRMLGGELQSRCLHELPLEKGIRTLFVYRKRAETPRTYPRKPGVPNKRPLGS